MQAIFLKQPVAEDGRPWWARLASSLRFKLKLQAKRQPVKSVSIEGGVDF
jgi:hypothetical protein